jgi:hypothetical protein
MARGSAILVLVTSGILAAVALVVLRPKSVEGILPQSLVEGLSSLGSAVNTTLPDARTGDKPGDFLVDAPEGLLADGPIAAMAGNQPVFIADVVTGYGTQLAGQVPAEITTVRPIMGCLLTPPLPGTVVGNVVAGQSVLPLGLLTYNDADLATAVQAFVGDYRLNGSPVVQVPDTLAYQSYDVVVTETAAPVYLVLQTVEGNRIWNIHTAPGARVERVVLLGGTQAGVANLDPVVPVEVILQDGLDACGIRPAYRLNPGHALVRAAESGSAAAVARLADLEAEVEAFGVWFRDSFGVLEETTRAGFDRGTVSVIGPVPGLDRPKAAFAALSGADIRTTQDDFFEIFGQVPEGEDFAARVRAIATSFAFGDLDNLRQGADF